MKYFYSSFFIFLGLQASMAQETQWANELVGFSSEERDVYYSPKFRAAQAVGKPNVLPNGTTTPCAWSPSGANIGTDWITVGFETPSKIRQIAVSENVNPGGISKIFGIDGKKNEILLYENQEPLTRDAGRLWNVIIPETTFEVYGIKLVIDHARKRGSKQIDAIAISDGDTPIEVRLNTVDWGDAEVQLESLGLDINSPFGEVAPIISPDGKELYFTRINHPDNIKARNSKVINQDIWYTSRKGKTWSSPQNIGAPLNNEEDNAVTCISADGKSLFILNVYNTKGPTQVGLSKSRRTGTGWSFPVKIEIEDFQALSHEEVRDGRSIAVTHTEFSITPDERVIIMGLKRSQTYGERDLYVSFRRIDGSYTRPRSLGPIVNTADIEGSPFIAADNKTLYFMSKGHLGFGNGDIFVSKRLDDTWVSWTEPLNLGQPINSPEWNGYINIPAASDYALLSSRQSKKESHDIYRVTLPPQLRPDPQAVVSGKVMNSLTNEPVKAEISLTSLGDSTDAFTLDFAYYPENGDYKFILPIGKDYIFSATEKGFVTVSDTLFLSTEKNYREIRLDLHMAEIKAGQKVVLNNLFFERAAYEIQENSFSELNRIISLMNEYPTMEVMLEGHTDNQGDLMKNIELAKNRVEAVKVYLIEKGGIDAGRIEVKSWGPARPVSSNASEASRKKNRRVEFTIVKL